MTSNATKGTTRRGLLTALPVLGAGVLGVGFWSILRGMSSGGFDPRAVANPHVGKPVPKFALPGLPGFGDGFSDADLAAQTSPLLVNFFASWCIPCVEEMPHLREIARELPVWGIAYEDKPAESAAFIQRDGSPYARVASDRQGRVAIDWGVTGVPETFLLAPGGKEQGGRILWHGTAVLTPQVFDAEIRPLLAAAR